MPLALRNLTINGAQVRVIGIRIGTVNLCAARARTAVVAAPANFGSFPYPIFRVFSIPTTSTLLKNNYTSYQLDRAQTDEIYKVQENRLNQVTNEYNRVQSGNIIKRRWITCYIKE